MPPIIIGDLGLQLYETKSFATEKVNRLDFDTTQGVWQLVERMRSLLLLFKGFGQA
jgi:hypothetical protein